MLTPTSDATSEAMEIKLHESLSEEAVVKSLTHSDNTYDLDSTLPFWSVARITP